MQLEEWVPVLERVAVGGGVALPVCDLLRVDISEWDAELVLV